MCIELVGGVCLFGGLDDLCNVLDALDWLVLVADLDGDAEHLVPPGGWLVFFNYL